YPQPADGNCPSCGQPCGPGAHPGPRFDERPLAVLTPGAGRRPRPGHARAAARPATLGGVHVAHLSLTDFRSYPAAELELEPGVTAFVGPNGHGKTNLVEAVGYVATQSSHRVASDGPLVRHGAARAFVRAAVVRDDRRALIELEINPGRSNRARLNRSPVPRARDVLGLLRSVLFAPEDLAMVKGDPAERRRFLD